MTLEGKAIARIVRSGGLQRWTTITRSAGMGVASVPFCTGIDWSAALALAAAAGVQAAVGLHLFQEFERAMLIAYQEDADE